jgi:hypothetical protein
MERARLAQWTGLTWGLVAGNVFGFGEGWVIFGNPTADWTDLGSCSWECLLVWRDRNQTMDWTDLGTCGRE